MSTEIETNTNPLLNEETNPLNKDLSNEPQATLEDKKCCVCWQNDSALMVRLSCKHEICEECRARCDFCPLCRKLIMVIAGDGLPSTLVCNECQGIFPTDQMRFCYTCNKDFSPEQNYQIKIICDKSQCNSCSLIRHVDVGHNTKPVHKFDLDLNKWVLLREAAKVSIPRLRHLLSDHLDDQRELGKILAIFEKLASSHRTSLKNISRLMVELEKSERFCDMALKEIKTSKEQKSVFLERLCEDGDFDDIVPTEAAIIGNPVNLPQIEYTEFYRTAQLSNKEHLWNQTGEKEDAVGFMVSKDVHLIAIGIYASRTEAKYKMTLKVYEKNEKGYRQLDKKVAQIHSSGYTMIHKIPMSQPIRLLSGTTYAASLKIEGEDEKNVRSYSMTSAHKKVIATVGKQTVEMKFIDTPLSKNGTDDDSGQLPLFCLSPVDRSPNPPSTLDSVRYLEVTDDGESTEITSEPSNDSESEEKIKIALGEEQQKCPVQ